MLSLLNTTFTNTLRQGSTLVGSLLSKLKARSTFFENQTCTKATLKDLNTAGLLKKASIITTPTAYNVGYINSVKPEQTLGSELITNGSFDTSIPIGSGGSGWKFIDSSRAGSSAEYFQGGVKLTRTTNLSRFRPLVGNTGSVSFFTSGIRNYVISYDLISTTDPSKNVSVSAGGASVTLPGTVGSHTVYFKNGGVNALCQFSPSSNTDIVLDNISIKEVIDADFTFTRNTTATRVNASGLIESVANNLPRIDYTVSNCGSWLLEPSRTNFQSRSEEFDNSVWTSVRGTISSNAATSPDGTLNADKFTGTSGSTSYVFDSKSVTGGGVYAISVFVKYQDIEEFKIVNFQQSGTAAFNIENGTIISNSGTYTEPKIEDYGNGWYRCSAKFTATATASINYGFFLDNAINKSIYLWGAQFEFGHYPTTYIPTTSGSVTRNAESANDAGSSDLISSTEGVLMAEISSLANDSTAKRLSINKDAFNRVTIEVTSANLLQFSIRESSTFRFFQTFAIDTTINNKLALKYKSGDSSLWVNGSKLSTKTESFDFTGNELVRLAFDDSVGSTFFSKTKQVQYYDSVLTDSELETLTSWVSFSDMANGQLYTIQ